VQEDALKSHEVEAILAAAAVGRTAEAKAKFKEMLQVRETAYYDQEETRMRCLASILAGEPEWLPEALALVEKKSVERQHGDAPDDPGIAAGSGNGDRSETIRTVFYYLVDLKPEAMWDLLRLHSNDPDVRNAFLDHAHSGSRGQLMDTLLDPAFGFSDAQIGSCFYSGTGSPDDLLQVMKEWSHGRWNGDRQEVWTDEIWERLRQVDPVAAERLRESLSPDQAARVREEDDEWEAERTGKIRELTPEELLAMEPETRACTARRRMGYGFPISQTTLDALPKEVKTEVIKSSLQGVGPRQISLYPGLVGQLEEKDMGEDVWNLLFDIGMMAGKEMGEGDAALKRAELLPEEGGERAASISCVLVNSALYAPNWVLDHLDLLPPGDSRDAAEKQAREALQPPPPP
jgi:hypothetical protein